MTRATLTASCLLLAAACGGEDPADFEIVQNQRPLSSCELSPTATSRIAEGTFDLSIGDRFSYLLTPRVRNRTGEDIVVTAARVHAFRATPTGPDLLRFLCDDGAVCDEWDLDLCVGRSCPVVPARGTASFEVPVMSRTVTGYYQGMMDIAVQEGRNPPQFELITEIRLVGEAEGFEVISEPFEFPVTLCLGCLVDYPEGSDSSRISGPDCCGARSPGGDPCHPGQDEPFDCHLCTRTLPEICNFGRLTCG